METTGLNRTFVVLALTMTCFAGGRPAIAANIASDAASDAAYNDGWQTGDNGGSGFGPWTLTTVNNNPSTGGFFIGDSANNGAAPSGDVNTGGESFGLYANGDDVAIATRSFTGGPLAPGQTFSLGFDNGFVDNSANSGVALVLNDASGSGTLGFFFQGGDSFYFVTDSAGATMTTVPFTDDGLSVAVTLLPGGGYSLSVDGIVRATGLLLNGAPAEVLLGNTHAGAGSSNDAFFNSLAVSGNPIPEPAGLALAGLALLGSTAMRRRRG